MITLSDKYAVKDGTRPGILQHVVNFQDGIVTP